MSRIIAAPAVGRMFASCDRQSRRRFLQDAARLGLPVAGLALLAGCGMLPSPTPTPKIPRIGVLSPDADEPSLERAAFLQGLSDLGWIEGKNIAVEYRWARERRTGSPTSRPN